ncbi:MAG: DUF5317 family protein [Candidatus Dormibacteria bacterium]
MKVMPRLLWRWAPGLALIDLGATFNVAVYKANGCMPVAAGHVRELLGADALSRMAAAGRLGDYCLLGAQSQYALLADRLSLPIPAVASLGDVFLAVGIIWILGRTIAASHRQRRLRSLPAG